ncbi:MAG: hypothetical protein AB1505_09730 [Candidatus Latescibacterota bacterium]
MATVKIVLVGGGSYAWGPNVVGNILGNGPLDGSHVTLYDLDAQAVERAYQLAVRMRERAGSRTTFEPTTQRDAALDGADFVVVTISTGGLQAMRVDLEVPEAYGILQTVGDTVGPGGANRTLRNVPVFVDLARAMEERCPSAWMLNCSNPLSALTRVVNQTTRIRALGLCHGVCGQARRFATFLGASLAECTYVNTGIDHCSFFTQLQVRGQDVGARLLEMGVDEWLALPPEPAREHAVFGPLYSCRCGLLLWRRLGALPAIGDRHLVEFFPGFLQGQASVERYGLVRTTIADREAGRARAQQQLDDWLAGRQELPGGGGSDDVGGWMAALSGGPAVEDNLNAPNVGQVPQLPLGAVVETRGVLDGAGFHPLVSPMPAALEAVVRPHVLREEMLVEAALRSDLDLAVAALATDPLAGRPEEVRGMLAEMVRRTARWLPQFA